jgi:hypothetical protein
MQALVRSSLKIAKSLDSNDGAGDGVVFMNRILEKNLQGFPGAVAQIGKKLPIIQKVLIHLLTVGRVPNFYILLVSFTDLFRYRFVLISHTF